MLMTEDGGLNDTSMNSTTAQRYLWKPTICYQAQKMTLLSVNFQACKV